MIGGRALAQIAARSLDEVRSRLALRGATRVGAGVTVFGWPRIACAGELVIGRGVVLISSPAPVELFVASGGSLHIGDGVVIESGATLRACGSIVIGESARIGVGCVLDDEGPRVRGIVVSRDAWVGDGAVLLADAHVAAGARVPRRAVVGSQDGSAPDVAPRPRASALPADFDIRVRTVFGKVLPGAKFATPDEDLSRMKGWDSLCALRAVVALEKEFGVSLPHDLLASQPRIDSVARTIFATAAQV